MRVIAFRLQDLTTVSSSTTQTTEDAVEVGGFSNVRVQLRVVAAAPAGSALVLQTAAVNDDDAYEDVVPGFDLSRTGNQTHRFDGLLRFARWRVHIEGTGSAKFLSDAVGHGGCQ